MNLPVSCVKCGRRDRVRRTGGADRWRGEDETSWHVAGTGTWMREPCLEDILRPMIAAHLDRTFGPGAC